MSLGVIWEGSKNDICRIWQENYGKEQELEELLPSFRAVGNQNPERNLDEGKFHFGILGNA